jgi:hypothetical protein
MVENIPTVALAAILDAPARQQQLPCLPSSPERLVTSFTALWLPILVSLVVVFLISSFIHMASPWHKNDYPKLANEEAVLDALRPLNLPPGDYMMPRPSSMAEMKSPEFVERVTRGPKVLMTVMPNGPAGMGGSLLGWAVFILVVTFIAAHVASAIIPPGAHWREVFHTIGLFTLAAYAFALWPLSIWYGRGWGITIKSTIDGLIYALATAFIFAWLWPH